MARMTSSFVPSHGLLGWPRLRRFVQGDTPSDLDIRAVYETHGHFLWCTLQRLGVADMDLHDAMQEVLLVVHEKLPSFRGEAKLETWLFAICLAIALKDRRRRARHARRLTAWSLESGRPDFDARTPESAAMARESVERILDLLEPASRLVFVMHELEHKSCDEIARVMGIPLGTVYSRLRAARMRVLAGYQRLEKCKTRRERKP